MHPYYELLRQILANGTDDDNRTNTRARRIFGAQTRYNLAHGFPLLTGKRVPFNLVLTELLWFIAGKTTLDFLHEFNNHIWDEWALDGQLGPVYGAQWRTWRCTDGGSIDQLRDVIKSIKARPNSRRLIVSAWNPEDLPNENLNPQQNVMTGRMALAPCHTMFQFAVIERKLHLQLYQRSADMFLGVPFNIASYALLQHMVASICDLDVGDFIHTFGDAHIYLNHMEQVEELLSREARAPRLPILEINPNITKIDDFQLSDFNLVGYRPLPSIKGDVAV